MNQLALWGSQVQEKTTLSDCILGLLKPQSGTVEIDGYDIYMPCLKLGVGLLDMYLRLFIL